MKILKTKAQLLKWRKAQKKGIGFVPTMGALHSGHLSLVESALRQNETLIVSIFVNPTQFGPKEDYKNYPRDEKRDLKLLKQAGVDAVFLPSREEMYEAGADTFIEPRKSLDKILEGRFRPGHFRGVCTIVFKLFALIRPTHAYFGEKDFQQVRVIEAMVEDLFIDVRIVRVPTVREKNGLALSSRNAYLNRSDRLEARHLYQTLMTASNLKAAAICLKKLGFKVQYLEAWQGRWCVAAFFKGVRLIDNIER